MKNDKTKAAPAVREFLAAQGRKGGNAGSVESKRRAALIRWKKISR